MSSDATTKRHPRPRQANKQPTHVVVRTVALLGHVHRRSGTVSSRHGWCACVGLEGEKCVGAEMGGVTVGKIKLSLVQSGHRNHSAVPLPEKKSNRTPLGSREHHTTRPALVARRSWLSGAHSNSREVGMDI